MNAVSSLHTVPEEDAEAHLNSLLWGNAAGSCRDPKYALRYAQAGATCVMFGSLTQESRAGNEGINLYFDEAGNSFNSLGLPNRRLEEALTFLPALRKDIHKENSILAVSISAGDAFSASEYEHMARSLVISGSADLVEGNFSCPNVVVGKLRKPVVCYDRVDFRDGVRALRRGAGSTPIAVKIAPITESRFLYDLVSICLEYHVEYIVAANTIGNCFPTKEDGSPALAMGRGGLGGPVLRPIVSGMIQMMAPQLKGTSTSIIAVGGIETGSDAYAYLRLGAHGFAFNTVLSRNGGDPDVFKKIAIGDEKEPGLLTLIQEHGIPQAA